MKGLSRYEVTASSVSIRARKEILSGRGENLRQILPVLETANMWK